VGLPDVVDDDDVRAAHPPQAPPLGDEALADLGVEAVVLGEHLDDDHVVEPLVDGAVDGGEGPGPDDALEAVAPDPDGGHRPPPTGSRRAAATSARPRETWALTVPTGRWRRVATSSYGRPSTSRSVTGSR